MHPSRNASKLEPDETEFKPTKQLLEVANILKELAEEFEMEMDASNGRASLIVNPLAPEGRPVLPAMVTLPQSVADIIPVGVVHESTVVVDEPTAAVDEPTAAVDEKSVILAEITELMDIGGIAEPLIQESVSETTSPSEIRPAYHAANSLNNNHRIEVLRSLSSNLSEEQAYDHSNELEP